MADNSKYVKALLDYVQMPMAQLGALWGTTPQKMSKALRQEGSNIYDSMKSAVTAPGRALSGQMNPQWMMDENGNLVQDNSKMNQEGLNFAMNMAGGGLGSTIAKPVEANSLGMFVGNIKGVGGKLPKTEFELAHELAQQRAALPVSEGGLGLPANNTAMDRARAMGVDLDNPLYYGSQNNILNFDPSKIGSRFDYSFGHHTTSSPNEASVYADSLTNAAENFNPKAKLSIPVAEGANVMKLYGRTENPLKIKTDYPAASMEADIQRSEIIDKLWNARQANKPYDAVIIDAKNNKNFIALKPELLRSSNAAFDPFRRNEAGILAGVGALPFIDYNKKDKK